MTKAKPFDIPKREVWEAFKKVKANRGAAGVDEQSIADFEVDLANNLYQLWNRLSSGSFSPSGAAGGHSEGDWRDATIGYTNGGGPNRARGCPPVSGASTGSVVPRRLLWLPTRSLCNRGRAYGTSALLAIRLGTRPRHQGIL